MNILYNGDSNMDGCEIGVENSISAFMSEKLGATASVNLAYTGCSNDRIYDTTVEYLKTNTPDFVLIGWTEPSRIQFFDDVHGSMVELNEFEIRRGKLTTRQESRNQQIKDLMSPDSSYAMGQTLYWHNKIYNLHSMLRHKKIPHLFFSAIEVFYPWIIEEKYRYNWHNTYFKPYQENMRNWGVENNYTQITPGNFHFEKQAQIDYTERLYQHIIDNQLLS